MGRLTDLATSPSDFRHTHNFDAKDKNKQYDLFIDDKYVYIII